MEFLLWNKEKRYKSQDLPASGGTGRVAKGDRKFERVKGRKGDNPKPDGSCWWGHQQR